MVCHLFLKKNPLSVRDRAGEVRHNFPPIGFAGCYYFVRAGMFYACHLKVIGVKRFIDNESVVPIAPRAHHGGRNISRTTTWRYGWAEPSAEVLALSMT